MFSVIIPLYNKEKYIGETIESVLNQVFNDFEIIIIDDGSTDNSLSIASSYNDNRIRIINQKNNGVSSARNNGIRNANFDWICFIDSDDKWSPYHISEFKKSIELFSELKVIANTTVYEEKYSVDEKRYIVENYFNDAIYNPVVNSSNICIHKDCIEKVGFFNEKLKRGEDLDMWNRLSQFYKILKSNSKTSYYRQIPEVKNIKFNINESVLSQIVFKNCMDSQLKIFYLYLISVNIRKYYNFKDYNSIFKLIRRFNVNLFNVNFIRLLFHKYKKINR